MNNFKDFLCHGCMKKYKYNGDFKELIGKKCKHCGFTVWSQEEQNLMDKLEKLTNPIIIALTIKDLSPIEKRLLQYWSVLAAAVKDHKISEEDFKKDLV